jgi:hypothetical protein
MPEDIEGVSSFGYDRPGVTEGRAELVSQPVIYTCNKSSDLKGDCGNIKPPAEARTRIFHRD